MEKSLAKYVFIGVDTHKEDHTACVTDCWHGVLETCRVANDPVFFAKFLEDVANTIPKGLIPIFGLEDTEGLGRPLAQFLLRSKHKVKEINPVKVDRERDRSCHPDKSDPQDAFSISKVLVDEFFSLPNARENDPMVAIRDLVGHRDNLVRESTRVKNRLHVLLHQMYPFYKKMFKDPFCKSALGFWKRFPHPALLADQDKERLGAYLRECSSNRVSIRKAEEILNLMRFHRGFPHQELSQLEIIRCEIIGSLVRELEILEKEIALVEEKLKRLVEDTGYKLRTLSGVDYVTEARIISVIEDIHRFSSGSKIARFCGIAPREKSSGKRRKHRKSNRGERQLNYTIHCIAISQIGVTRRGKPKNPIARAYYLKKLAEGKTKKQAITCLKRRLCDIIYAMMRDGSEYVMPQPKEYSVLLTADPAVNRSLRKNYKKMGVFSPHKTLISAN